MFHVEHSGVPVRFRAEIPELNLEVLMPPRNLAPEPLESRRPEAAVQRLGGYPARAPEGHEQKECKNQPRSKPRSLPRPPQQLLYVL